MFIIDRSALRLTEAHILAMAHTFNIHDFESAEARELSEMLQGTDLTDRHRTTLAKHCGEVYILPRINKRFPAPLGFKIDGIVVAAINQQGCPSGFDGRCYYYDPVLYVYFPFAFFHALPCNHTNEQTILVYLPGACWQQLVGWFFPKRLICSALNKLFGIPS